MYLRHTRIFELMARHGIAIVELFKGAQLDRVNRMVKRKIQMPATKEKFQEQADFPLATDQLIAAGYGLGNPTKANDKESGILRGKMYYLRFKSSEISKYSKTWENSAQCTVIICGTGWQLWCLYEHYWLVFVILQLMEDIWSWTRERVFSVLSARIGNNSSSAEWPLWASSEWKENLHGWKSKKRWSHISRRRSRPARTHRFFGYRLCSTRAPGTLFFSMELY